MKFSPGDEVTAVYSRLGGRTVLLMEVTKVGRKYLYGITLSRNPEGVVREGHDIQVNIEESTIYPGLRHDLRDAEFKYREDYRKWQHQKQNRKNEIKRELSDFVRKRVDEWGRDNPMPQPPELPDQETKGD